jgi:membrane-bound serine protease (ClpP class)
VPLVVAITVLLGGFWALAMTKAIAVRRRPPTVGPWQIVGMDGVVRGDGQVAVRGELWRANADEPLRPGERVRVDSLDGLTLHVHRIET